MSASGYNFLVSEVNSSAAQLDPGPGTVYLYLYDGGTDWVLDGTVTVPDAVSSVALSGDNLTCVFGAPGYNSATGRVYITTDFGTTYTTFDGDNLYDWFGYYVSVNYAGTRIVANSSNGDGQSNYIKIFTLE
jgi:hypothetical protein